MLGWHWLAADRRLQFGTQEIVEVGKTYTASGPIKMCFNGMHACRRAIDALQYAKGPVICRVRLSGEIQHEREKSVGRHRTVLWVADATAVLHEFSLVCAENALGEVAALGHKPDARSWAVLEVKRRWLQGKATAQELNAATDAAKDATQDAAARATAEAAWDAAAWAAGSAGAAAGAAGAVWAVAGAAAMTAAETAAAWAAWAASRATAEATAAKDTQNQILEQMLLEIPRD